MKNNNVQEEEKPKIKSKEEEFKEEGKPVEDIENVEEDLESR